jgi:hypothetical protein
MLLSDIALVEAADEQQAAIDAAHQPVRQGELLRRGGIDYEDNTTPGVELQARRLNALRPTASVCSRPR